MRSHRSSWSIISLSVPFVGFTRSTTPSIWRMRGESRSGVTNAAGVDLDDEALHLVLQLAHVARPVVALEELHRLLREARRRACPAPPRSARGSASARSGMSSRRSRSGGTRIGKTLRR